MEGEDGVTRSPPGKSKQSLSIEEEMAGEGVRQEMAQQSDQDVPRSWGRGL
jgi:hypothetical protein